MTRVRIALVVLACAAAMTAASFVPRLLNVGGAVSDAPGTPRSAGFVATTRPAGSNLVTPVASPARASRAHVRHPKALRTPSVVAHTVSPSPSPVGKRNTAAGWPWPALGKCEAGRFGARYGAPGVGGDPGYEQFEGLYNFTNPTWLSFGGGAYARHAYDATVAQQTTIARRVLARQGWGAWPTCSRKLGLR